MMSKKELKPKTVKGQVMSGVLSQLARTVFHRATPVQGLHTPGTVVGAENWRSQGAYGLVELKDHFKDHPKGLITNSGEC